MKFSEVESSSWDELRPYLDTCLIPVTGLTGKEQPHEVTEALERLRDILDLVEIPFKGRTITYPSIQYGRENIVEFINEICHNVKSSGFKFVFLISADVNLLDLSLSNIDLVVTPQGFTGSESSLSKTGIQDKIQLIWQSGGVV
ncbi:DUF2487 family protein [Paenibacillus segetis]|uniref:DUF2487 domain-containing protein n=1 Tax=Paenibacillus segetis TaxID=1325360 RepID=A0ABQ1YH26_9BACL|nr:DUF2487 family protein [Paenibacillus segetis]GGH24294.1 hypothetical protein GCM10008013_23960 [Paenibacillus segetis]